MINCPSGALLHLFVIKRGASDFAYSGRLRLNTIYTYCPCGPPGVPLSGRCLIWQHSVSSYISNRNSNAVWLQYVNFDDRVTQLPIVGGTRKCGVDHSLGDIKIITRLLNNHR